MDEATLQVMAVSRLMNFCWKTALALPTPSTSSMGLASQLPAKNNQDLQDRHSNTVRRWPPLMYANWLAQMPEPKAERMLTDLRDRMKRAYSAPSADQQASEDFGLQIARDTEQMIGRFCKKQKIVRRRIRIQIKG